MSLGAPVRRQGPPGEGTVRDLARPGRAAWSFPDLDVEPSEVPEKHRRRQPTRTGEGESQYRTDAEVDPKNITRKSIGEFFVLHDEFRKSGQPEAAEQQAERGHHGHDAEVRRKKQPCQDDD